MNEWNEALVLKYNESAISTFLLGSGKMNTEKMTSFFKFLFKRWIYHKGRRKRKSSYVSFL